MRISIEDKCKFLKKNKLLAKKTFEVNDQISRDILIAKIIKQFGYSQKTYEPDIERSFQTAWNWLKLNEE